MLDPGEKAPDFALPNQDGNTVALSDFRGQRVVVYFYPEADTGCCTVEAKGFANQWETFRERDIAVVGISDDPVEKLADFAETYELPFELLSDADGSVGRAYDSYGTRSVGQEEYTGPFRNTYVVDEDGRIAATYRGVDPEGHAEEVLEGI